MKFELCINHHVELHHVELQSILIQYSKSLERVGDDLQ